MEKINNIFKTNYLSEDLLSRRNYNQLTSLIPLINQEIDDNQTMIDYFSEFTPRDELKDLKYVKETALLREKLRIITSLKSPIEDKPTMNKENLPKEVVDQVNLIQEYYELKKLKKLQSREAVVVNSSSKETPPELDSSSFGIGDRVAIVAGQQKGIIGVIKSVSKLSKTAKVSAENRAVQPLSVSFSQLRLLEKKRFEEDESRGGSRDLPDFVPSFEQEQSFVRNMDFTEKKDEMYQNFLEITGEILNAIQVDLNRFEVVSNAIKFKNSRDLEFKNNKAIKVFLASFIFAILHESKQSPDIVVEGCEFDNWQGLAYFECALKKSFDFDYSDFELSVKNTLEGLKLIEGKLIGSGVVGEEEVKSKPVKSKKVKSKSTTTKKKKEGLEAMTLAQLKDLARQRNIKGISTAKKSELIEILKNTQEN